MEDIVKNEAVFIFENVEYEVSLLSGGARKLLNNVSRYSKPGFMIAPMDASGAGKSNLLNILSQRQKMGNVKGDMLDAASRWALSSRETLGLSSRSIFMMILLRSARRWSSLPPCNRNATCPDRKKLHMLTKSSTFSSPTASRTLSLVMSLAVEQKKRLTVGVDLAAKTSPSLPR
jgi:ATP-binding cassette subfamily G (WHITE) protein 2 (SNQ2)